MRQCRRKILGAAFWSFRSGEIDQWSNGEKSALENRSSLIRFYSIQKCTEGLNSNSDIYYTTFALYLQKKVGRIDGECLFLERPCLNDYGQVEQLKEKLLEALKLQIATSHAAEQQLYQLLLIKRQQLKTIGKRRFS